MIQNKDLLFEKMLFGHICMIAQSQMGKSYKVAKIIEKFMKNHNDYKCLIYNTQYFKEFQKIGTNVNGFNSFLLSFSQNQITVYNPELNFLEVTESEIFIKMLRTIFLTQKRYYEMQEYKQKNIFIIVDEIHQFLPKFERTKVPELKLILSRGLNPYKIQLLTICQTIQQTDNLVFSESNAMIVGKLEKHFWNFARKYKGKLPSTMIEKERTFLFVDSLTYFEI